MKEIVSRLHENRQVELAKKILESNGYVVTKKLEENQEETKYTIVAVIDDGTRLFYNANEGTFSTEEENATEYAEYEIVKSDFDRLCDLRVFNNMFISSDHDTPLAEPPSDSKRFEVGDKFSFSGLYGGSYDCEVVEIRGDKLDVDITWTSEDTGEPITEPETYKIVKDSDGNERIVVWEYHGEKGYVYPPEKD